MKKRDTGPHYHGGKLYSTKAEKMRAESRTAQAQKWRDSHPVPRRSEFQEWLCTFIEEKEIDLSEPVKAGDGSTLQVGDVIQQMHDTAPNEQDQIKKILVMIDFKNGSVLHFIQHAAQALNKSHRIAL